MKFQLLEGNQGAKLWIDNEYEKDGIYFADVHMKLAEKSVPHKFVARAELPCVDCYSTWGPDIKESRILSPEWEMRRTYSSLAQLMPVQSIISVKNRNRYTIAINDAFSPIGIKTGIVEETASITLDIVFFTHATAEIEEYSATIRVDMRDIPYYDSIYDVVNWWEKDCGYPPSHVPEHAKLPMNSLWYSFHQRLDVDEIIKQCRLSKEIGMDTVIVDDGWQTDDNGRGYSYCGDWEVCEKKIPNMKEFVDRVHETGMKFMLWYSVPFVGVHSKAFERFKTMLLCDNPDRVDFASLDPRYKEARDYLIGIYTKAVKDWGLDGLKLDFIDWFKLASSNFAPDDRRDFVSLEEAIDRLMTDITDALREINPDILIEFRQAYVGPAIRKYGNMLRVSDCPNDSLRNRLGSIDLRFTSGNTPVRSDMLMWHVDDPVESAAMQFINVIFSVPQISVLIDKLPEDHYKMLKFYLAFWRANADTLLDGKLWANDPQSGYSSAGSRLGDKAITVLFTDSVADCTGIADATVINGTRLDAVYVKGCNGKNATVLNCMGEEISSFVIDGNIAEIDVPPAGMICIK